MRTAFLCLLVALTGLLILVYRQSSSNFPSLVRIQQNGKIGYIDPTGKIAIPAIYFNGSDFSEGLAAVREGGVYGYIDPSGRYTIKPQFDWGEPFSDGLALVNKDGHFYFIDHNGTSPSSCRYKEISPFRHGVAVVETNSGNRGLIDRHGKLLLDTLYNVITDFDEGLAFVDQHRADSPLREGVIDTLGHFIVPIGKYETVNPPKHGYCMVSDTTDDQIVIDRSGKIVLRRPETHHSSISIDGFSEAGQYPKTSPEK